MSTLILSCNTGQGHNSCAQAIKEYYDSVNEQCVIKDALSFISLPLSKFISWGHVTIYRKCHFLFRIGYKYSEKHPTLFKESSAIYHLLSLGANKAYDYIISSDFDKIICTHPFASLMMTEIKKKYNLSLPISLIATDYTCNPGTKESDVDIHFIPHKLLLNTFENEDIKETDICISGIPIRQMFYKKTNKNEAKKALNLDNNKKHLLIMCGSMGCGPIKKIAKGLIEYTNDNFDITIVCGTNNKLKKSLKKRYSSNKNVKILGYVKNISLLMDGADLYLTKPGGISVTEASTKNLPMVFINAVAGCEEYNKMFFIQRGGAKTGKSIDEIISISINLLEDENKLNEMCRCLSLLPKNNASEIIYNKMKNLSEN